MATRKTTPPSMEVRMSLEAIGERIAAARKERRLTQRALAEMLGVGTQAVLHIEQGRPTVQIGHYARAVWALEIHDMPLVQYLTPPYSDEN